MFFSRSCHNEDLHLSLTKHNLSQNHFLPQVSRTHIYRYLLTSVHLGQLNDNELGNDTYSIWVLCVTGRVTRYSPRQIFLHSIQFSSLKKRTLKMLNVPSWFPAMSCLNYQIIILPQDVCCEVGVAIVHFRISWTKHKMCRFIQFCYRIMGCMNTINWSCTG